MAAAKAIIVGTCSIHAQTGTMLLPSTFTAHLLSLAPIVGKGAAFGRDKLDQNTEAPSRLRKLTWTRAHSVAVAGTAELARSLLARGEIGTPSPDMLQLANNPAKGTGVRTVFSLARRPWRPGPRQWRLCDYGTRAAIRTLILIEHRSRGQSLGKLPYLPTELWFEILRWLRRELVPPPLPQWAIGIDDTYLPSH